MCARPIRIEINQREPQGPHNPQDPDKQAHGAVNLQGQYDDQRL